MQNTADLKKANTPPFESMESNKWFTKDRKWNVVFWIALSGGTTFATFARGIKHLEFIPFVVMLFTLLSLAALMVFFNNTTAIKDKKFLNNEGIEITKKQLPGEWGTCFTLLGVFLASWAMGGFLDKNVVVTFISYIFLFSGFALYFIVKNCPISILFNSKYWESLPVAPRSGSDNYYLNSSPKPNYSRQDDIYYNPAYSSLECNIHHKTHHHRRHR